MGVDMAVEFSVALDNLKRLVAEYSPLGELSNEAQTRFSFIDRLLQECLGWSNSDIRVEIYEDGERSDYECGNPRSLIIEAKRSIDRLPLPPKSTRNPNRFRLDSLVSYSDVTGAAIRQAQAYCQSRGVELAAVANGPQLVIFLASRNDGQSPLSGDAFVFDGYDDLVKSFAQIFDLLSRDGVLEARYRGLLQAKGVMALPSKLATLCVDYYAYNYASDFQESLRNAASLVIEDLGRSADVEREFLEECYCESGPLSQYSLLGRNILSARYAALFKSDATGSRVEAVNPRRGSAAQFSEKVVAEALARRPLTLIGDVGVGKTSFLKHLIKVSAKEAFKDAVAIYFDLGAAASLAASTKDAFLDQVERAIRDDLKVNKLDAQIVEAIYAQELAEFDGGIMSGLKVADAKLFAVKRLELISTLAAQRENHLRLVLEYVAKKRSCQVVIVIDNADQRSPDVQTDAFVIAQELCAQWNAIVFIALRPQTFHGSKRSGAVSAYPSKVFVIPPPKLEEAIDKRLMFAQKIAEGRLPVHAITGISLHLESLAILIKVLRDSLAKSDGLREFLVNVSAGNIRLAVELVARFFGNPNVQSEKIVRIVGEGDSYLIPVHEFAKTALLGDYAHFQESSSVASNVFDVVYPDAKEHFLSLLILGYLSWDVVVSTDSEGFVRKQAVMEEMQGSGYTQDQIAFHLVRLTRKKLVEAPERRTLEGEEELEIGLPESFRITSLGAYILKRWAGEFSFIEAMAFDTPIFDADVRTDLAKSVNDNRLHARYSRAVNFRDYLSGIWQPIGGRPYFEWEDVVATGADSFNRVARRLSDLGYLRG
jgi:GTPase SAR1 family protein